MNNLLTSIIFLCCTAIFGQAKGSISGTVLDNEFENSPLPFANVFIKGTTIGTTTDIDGNYELSVSAGTHTIVFSFIGYKTVEVSNVQLKAGEHKKINQTLSASEGVSLNEITITASANKESVSALLTEQKKATAIVQKIGAEELAQKGVSDVAAALTKTTGISKEEGSGGVFVRGLGDRYNITTLNGLPLPSNNASKKNIDLGIFSTDIVEFIGIDKTYNVLNFADFAGANVNIASKNYKGNGFLELGLGTGVNSEAIGTSEFYLNEGPNYSGFYTKNYPSFPLSNYNFTTSWDRTTAPTPINGSASLKGGESFILGENTQLNAFAVASFDNGYVYTEGISRGSVNVAGVARKDYDFTSFSYNTNTTLMSNLVLTHKEHSLKYNGLFVNATSQKQDEYVGTIDIFDYAPEGGAFVQRATFDRTKLFVHQLLGDVKISDAVEVNWGTSYNFVANNVPNRRQNIVTPDNWDNPDGPKSFLQTNNASDNHRFYQNLEEEELAANVSASYSFSKNKEEIYKGKLIVGYSGRFKTVDFQATQFNFRINRRTPQPLIADVYNLDSYFNQANLNANLFSLETFRGNVSQPNALEPQTYGGPQDIHAGFASVEYTFNPKLTVIAGVRGEQINQTINWNTSLSKGTSDLDAMEILPMLSVKYAVNDTQNLKFAASKSYTLPQYIERALFQFVGATQSSVGNPNLYASTNYNADVKWEFFPKSSEIISLGIFGKAIQNPINEVIINSASNDISYVNSGDQATVLGAEFELRKNIFDTEAHKLSAGFNTSYMYSNQELDNEKVVKETTDAGYGISVDFSNTEDKISGASDLLLNADVSYFKTFSTEKSLQATVTYNYFSDRISALGTEGKGNLVDKGLGTLDFILKSKLSKKLGVDFSAKNILNPTLERVQDKQNVLVSAYKLGLNVKLSVNYTF